jgi:glutamate formiminotransferase/formiminotetrahydrofolate cyclodeaminase
VGDPMHKTGARTAVLGAHLNVKINTVDLEDEQFVNDILKKSSEIVKKANKLEQEILEIVNSKIEN